MAGPSGKATPAAASGLLRSLRRLLATLLETAQLRLDLLLNELEQEKLRLYDALVWAVLAWLLIGLGLLLGAALLVLLAPEAWRALVLGGLCLACLGAGAWMLQRARLRLANPAGALAATRAELATDQAALNPPPPA